MRTFQEYITWVRENEKKLDGAAGVQSDYLYEKSLKEILGRNWGIHPSTDNGILYLGSNRDLSSIILKECEFGVTLTQEIPYHVHKLRGTTFSPYYERWSHKNGVATAQIVEYKEDYVFYIDENPEIKPHERLFLRLLDTKDAKYYFMRRYTIELSREPDSIIKIQTRVQLNPHGSNPQDSRRENHRRMEETVISLMELIIKHDVPAFYYNRCTAEKVVVNSPTIDKLS